MTYGGARSLVSVTGSPFVYQNTRAHREEVVISGGTLAQVEFSRDGASFDVLGATPNHCILNPYDRIRVNYLLAPTIAVYPL